jgi:hypothetical protein
MMYEDAPIVEHWLKFHPQRFFLGGLSGILAAWGALIVGGLLCLFSEMDPFTPATVLGTILLGSKSMTIGSTTGLVAGLLVAALIGGFWGLVYAQMTYTNRFFPLLLVGLTWGIYSWIFTWNLFLQSFLDVYSAELPTSAALLVCLAYGFFLTMLGPLDERRKVA